MSAVEFTMPRIFSDDMIIQRGLKASVWGTAEPGGTVSIELAGFNTVAIVDKKGQWVASLPVMDAGGPYEMKISDNNETKIFHNVLVGDVWIASGQSNMDWRIAQGVNDQEGEDNHKEVIADAKFPNIRFFTVPLAVSNTPQNDVPEGRWVRSSPGTAGGFSAVAYFFAQHIHQEKGVPIGIIQSAVGGTPAEYWLSQEMLKSLPDYSEKVEELQAKYAKKGEYFAYSNEVARQRRELIKNANDGLNKGIQNVDYDEGRWNKMAIPGIWEQYGLPDHDGFVWFRKTIEVPGKWKGKDLMLNLAEIDDQDITWFNGEIVGKTNEFRSRRTYKIPGRFVKTGKNIIAVRVLDTGGGGGFVGQPEEFKLNLISEGSTTTIPLSGEWLFNASLEPALPILEFEPSYLFNAMVAPLIPYSIKGAIWYQGENNAGKAFQYQNLFPALIQDWRVRWKQGYFPFIFVQLANYMERKEQPSDDAWAELREAQLMALQYPNTGMAVTIDIGEADDIHPRNKKDVGKRLALAALKISYNKDIVHSGPIYKAMEVKENEIYLTFSNTGSGLHIKNSEQLKGFAIAGADKKFYWADARIVDDQVIVSRPNVSNPVAVRYAWESNPEATLYNKEGLPASPFRTDNWKGITE